MNWLGLEARPGDFRFKDINGDGKITSDDRTVTGSYHPDYTYGITNRFNYKNFDLNIFIQGVMGREVLNLTHAYLKMVKQILVLMPFLMIVGDLNQIQVMVYIQELTEEVIRMVIIIGHPAIKLKMVAI